MEEITTSKTQTPPPDTSTDCAEHLINLIVNQDHIAQSWLQHLITIEAGLAIGLGFLLRPAESGKIPEQVLPWFAVVLIPVLGIAAAAALVAVIVRERKWQAWYVQQFNSLPGGLPRVFPADKGVAGSIAEQKGGFISRVVVAFAVALIIVWSIVLVALI